MFVDIVYPKNNEKEFVEIAEKIGVEGLVFVYPYSKSIKEENKKMSSNINICSGILADHKTALKSKVGAGLVLVKSSAKDRFVFEKIKPDVIFDLEFGERADFMHHRNSGLNQVLCKLAAKNNVTVGIDCGRIISLGLKKQAQIFGRISQNIKFCRKYKVKMILASFADDPYLMRSPHDLSSLGIILGMHPKEASDSLETVYKRVKKS